MSDPTQHTQYWSLQHILAIVIRVCMIGNSNCLAKGKDHNHIIVAIMDFRAF